MRTDTLEYAAPPGSGALGPRLPEWRTFGELQAADLPTPPAIVDGLLRKGEISVLGGASKSFKSWAALDLALAVACGRPWMGRESSQGRVLLVNMELPEWAIRQRLQAIARVRMDQPRDDAILIWTLRGHSVTPDEIRAKLKSANPGSLDCMLIDPAYRLLAGRDENSASDINDLLGKVAGIALDTDAHVILPAHFAKGNASGKDALDRVSGSGVFARFPDSILTLTRHEEENAFTLESVLRTFPPASPVVVRWEHPVFGLDDTLDPTRLKQPSVGRKQKYDSTALAALLKDGRLSSQEWHEKAEERFDMPRKTFTDYRDRLVRKAKVIKSATSDEFYLPEETPPVTADPAAEMPASVPANSADSEPARGGEIL